MTPETIRRRNPTRFGVLSLLVLIMTACSVGPFEIAWRAAEQDQLAVDLTVTAVLATNTQIAILRTATAEAFSQPIVKTTQPPLVETATPQALPTSQVQPPSPTSPPPVPTGDIQLRYSVEALTILNVSGGAQDLSELSFHSDAGELFITKWDNGFLTAPLNRFPAGDCMMAWSAGAPQQPRPADCDTRHSWIAINNLEDFWLTEGAFEVRWFGQTVSTCASSWGVCYVTLP